MVAETKTEGNAVILNILEPIVGNPFEKNSWDKDVQPANEESSNKILQKWFQNVSKLI